jgi:hypothetical protein
MIVPIPAPATRLLLPPVLPMPLLLANRCASHGGIGTPRSSGLAQSRGGFSTRVLLLPSAICTILTDVRNSGPRTA